jgi:hypothetical protein
MSSTKTAGIMLMTLVAVVSALFADSGQVLADHLNEAVRSWQAGWVPDPPVTEGTPPRQGFRWRGKDGDVLLTMRTLVDAATAQAELQAHVIGVSTGVSTIAGVGDRAYVAGVPGGFTTMYVAVGRNMFVLTLRQPPNLVKPLAERFASILRQSDR